MTSEESEAGELRVMQAIKDFYAAERERMMPERVLPIPDEMVRGNLERVFLTLRETEEMQALGKYNLQQLRGRKQEEDA